MKNYDSQFMNLPSSSNINFAMKRLDVFLGALLISRFLIFCPLVKMCSLSMFTKIQSLCKRNTDFYNSTVSGFDQSHFFDDTIMQHSQMSSFVYEQLQCEHF